jgi:hypothetical protein
MKVLLVVPDFPIPPKRKVNHDFMPVGLLKIGTYFKKALGWDVRLHFGNHRARRFVPNQVWITSLFTYWSQHVVDSTLYYHRIYPGAKVVVGGIYASLMPDDCATRTRASVHIGLMNEAEEWCKSHRLNSQLLHKAADFQILHGMRGCFRKCKFCGTWKLEPEMTFERDLSSRVYKNHVVFYDNNFLKNDNIRDILRELAQVRVRKKRVTYECQSGFDGRILDEELARLIHDAHFINPRIAWDNSYDDFPQIERQIRLLEKAGYKRKDISVFMLYNWQFPFDVLERKRLMCWDWRVQVSDCRFRPLTQTFDNYNPRRDQTTTDYYIHENWTDKEIKQFRRNVRRHNICVRHGFPFYSKDLETMKVSKKRYALLVGSSRTKVRELLKDAWYPDQFTSPRMARDAELPDENTPDTGTPSRSTVGITIGVARRNGGPIDPIKADCD